MYLVGDQYNEIMSDLMLKKDFDMKSRETKPMDVRARPRGH